MLSVYQCQAENNVHADRIMPEGRESRRPTSLAQVSDNFRESVAELGDSDLTLVSRVYWGGEDISNWLSKSS